MYAIERYVKENKIITVPYECEDRPRYNTDFGVGVHNGACYVYIGDTSFRCSYAIVKEMARYCEDIIWHTARSFKAMSRVNFFNVYFSDEFYPSVEKVTVGQPIKSIVEVSI